MSQVVVGNLRVNLTAGTSAFTTDMAKAGQTGKKAAQDIQEGFNGVNLGEARGSFMFAEEMLGVRLPRHLNSLLATLPGLGTAMAAVFPVLGAMVLVEKITAAVAKFDEMKDKMHAAAAAYDELAQASERHAQSIIISNLKLADQLRLLQGKVTVNGPAIAMEEARLKAEELTAAIQKAIKEEKTLLEKQDVGFWKSLLGEARTADIVKPISDAKEAIGELERQQGIALTAHDAAAVASIQKELDTKRAALATWLTEKQTAEATARAQAIAKDSAANERAAVSHAHSGKMSYADAETNAQKENLAFAEKTNEAYGTRARLISNALLELKAESEEEKAQLTNAGLSLAIDRERDKLRNVSTIGAGKSTLSTGSSFDANGKYMDAEATKTAKDNKDNLLFAQELSKAHLYDVGVQAKINDELDKQRKAWDGIAALTDKDALATQEHIIKMQVASGVITKIQGDQRTTALYAQGELRDTANRNAELSKQLALVQQLNALTNGGAAGSDADKAAYAKAMADYQAFLLQKEKAKAASDAKINKAEEDAAARRFAIEKKAIDGVTNLFNTGVQGWINNQETFAQAAQNAFASFAESAIMGFVKAAEQQLIYHMIGKSLNEEDKLSDASASARKVFKSVMGGVPFPLNVVLAPVAAAGVFAAAMAFEHGGEVPDGYGGIPSILHPREMVLPEALADVVRGAAANNGGGNANGSGGGNTYAPTIHAGLASAAQIDTMLKGHFDRWVRSEARKRYTRTN